MTNQLVELDQLLDDCLDAIDSYGWTVDDCLAHYAGDRDRLEPLLRAAEMSRLLQRVEPSPVFRAQALNRLQARLEARPRPQPEPLASQSVWARLAAYFQSVPLARTMAYAAMGLILAIAVADVSSSSIRSLGSALPGDNLYPIKLAVEDMRLQLAPSTAGIRLHLEFAEVRLQEAEELAVQGDQVHLMEVLDRYNQLIDGNTSFSEQIDALDETSLLEVESELSAQQGRLEDLLDQVPGDAQRGINTAIEASKKGQETAAQERESRGGSQPELTPTTENANQNNYNCPDGTRLHVSLRGPARSLALRYKVPFATARDLFCEGLTADQVEAELELMTTQESP